MTGSSTRNTRPPRERVPGVYFEPQPRAPAPPFVRTDVAGFVGFRPPATPVATPSLVRCDDYQDYRLAFGDPPDDGTLLGRAVRAYFVNGGSRCYVATVARPDF